MQEDFLVFSLFSMENVLLSSSDVANKYISIIFLCAIDESDSEEYDRPQDTTSTAGRARRTRAKTFKVN